LWAPDGSLASSSTDPIFIAQQTSLRCPRCRRWLCSRAWAIAPNCDPRRLQDGQMQIEPANIGLYDIDADR
jgi:hypothetical protein